MCFVEIGREMTKVMTQNVSNQTVSHSTLVNKGQLQSKHALSRLLMNKLTKYRRNGALLGLLLRTALNTNRGNIRNSEILCRKCLLNFIG